MPPKRAKNAGKKGKPNTNRVKVPSKVKVPKRQGNEDSDVELSEDDIGFFAEHSGYSSFLSSLNADALSKNEIVTGKKATTAFAKGAKAGKVDDLEFDTDSDLEEYEKQPRKRNAEWEEKSFKKLPIKTADGRIVQVAEEPVDEDEDNSEKELDNQVDSSEEGGVTDEEAGDMDDEEEEEEAVPEMAQVEAEPKISKKQYIITKKEKLAELAQEIIEDPEKNIEKLKGLRDIAKEQNSTIKKFAFLTQLAVYKDIIPGYRIRNYTEQELTAKLSKDVKKLRNYEETLLQNYQAYLQSLENAHKNHNDPNVEPDDLSIVAIRCLCDLLTSVTHFNFRLNIMTVIISRMGTKHPNKISEMCCQAVIELFQNDESGEASEDAVKLIAKMIKSKAYLVNDEALNTFLHLRLRDELVIHQDDDKSIKRKKKDRAHRSRKARKIAKENKEIEKEMKEAEAEIDYDHKRKVQTETLKHVFTTYFRILKHAQTSPLLPSVLEGLAVFGHLINVDFFQDLLKVLKKIMAADEENPDQMVLSTRSSLLCILTAFQILSGQGEALNIDLKDFFEHLYSVMMPLALNMNVDGQSQEVEKPQTDKKYTLLSEAELLLKNIDMLLIQRRHVPPERAAAFLKRLALIMLDFPEKVVIQCLNMLRKLMVKYPKLDALLSSEDRAGNGIYLKELNDPELCNPFATSLWELALLQNHYNPKIRAMSEDLMKYSTENH
ncbi:nucleolar complex-associated protein 3 [Basidiobolus meristosporus CBS 931.73]|uniref:Nucleolar complex-associated protein 3 n=1 Tax=Basidiobolus meristosporus CBS 931.73 TaxID=1314790 RepID=A0A1Y1YM10_9FUNG|nr:nucleolar complex-associated protein 3 [Basidiobolus meristosporus CBS 931.73]|eukprot:ORX99050.1 nucleolar complex-associated protein 3 [Basidiobolus meristosporus CBS 931.73]